MISANRQKLNRIRETFFKSGHDADDSKVGFYTPEEFVTQLYGWAADDPVGLQHAVARSILSYACFLFVPEPYKSSAISVAVLLCYTYSLIRMRKA